MNISENYLKKTTHYFLSFVLIIGLLVAIKLPLTAHAAASTELSVSPSTQTISSGSNVTVSILMNPGGASINTIHSIVNFNSSNFSVVSVETPAAFGIFPYKVSSNSVSFTAGTTTPITTSGAVAIITLRATGSGNSAINLSAVCAANDNSDNCSSAYDSVTNRNDLSNVTGANYTVTSGANTSNTSNSPIISNLKISNISSTGATISWLTNVPSTSSINYGATKNLGTSYQNPYMTKEHTVAVGQPNINQGTTYYFTVSSTSANGSSSSSPGQFTSLGYVVTIDVYNSANKPIVGANVSANGKSGTTNSSGAVTLNNVLAGPQTVTIKSGNKTTKHVINIGKVNLNTKSFQPEHFILAAANGRSNSEYIEIAVIVILIASLIYFSISKKMKSKKQNNTEVNKV